MEYQLSYFETVAEYERNQPDSKFTAYGLAATMAIAGGAITGGRIRVVKIESADRKTIIAVWGLKP